MGGVREEEGARDCGRSQRRRGLEREERIEHQQLVGTFLVCITEGAGASKPTQCERGRTQSKAYNQY